MRRRQRHWPVTWVSTTCAGFYDRNHITIEGHTRLTFTEDVAARFLAYGWNVLRVGDANDIERIEHALDIFHKTQDRPTFIVLDSHIGYGSPHKQDTAAAHGEPLGEEEIRLSKQFYGWPEDTKFLVPNGVYEHFGAGIGVRGAEARRQWTERFAAYRAKYPDRATEIELMQRRELPAGWDRNLPVFPNPIPRGSRGGTCRARRDAGEQHGSGGFRRSWTVEQDDADVLRARETSRPRARQGKTCISAFASMPWPPL